MIDNNEGMSFPVFDTKDAIKGACRIASKNRLAVSGWAFYDLFKSIIEEDNVYEVDKMTIAYKGDTPVGCSVIFRSDNFGNGSHIGCFVRKNERRRGVGTRLVEALEARHGGHQFHEGIQTSLEFWKKNGGYAGKL